jgi:hypothetical protein
MSLAFRSVQPAAEMRWHALLATDLAPARSALQRVLALRIARIAGGAVGAASGMALFVLTLVRMAADPRLVDYATPLSTWLARGVAGALVTWLACRIALPFVLRGAFHALPSPSRDAARELAALETEHPVHVAERVLARLEPWSVGLPLVAFALLAPLTLHMSVAFSAGGVEKDFDGWIAASVVVVGHAHLALAAHGIVWARRVARTPRDMLPTLPGWLWAWAAAIVAAAVPGMILYLIPPLLTAATGLVFIPAAYLGMRRVVAGERLAIAHAWDAAFP